MSDEAETSYPSLHDLREAHRELLIFRREHDDTPELYDKIDEFIQKSTATGFKIYSDDDRWAVQSLLDYWSNILHSAGIEHPNLELEESKIAIQVLYDAWTSFATYDYNSTLARDRFLRLRKWILGLGVAATFLAVLHTVLTPVETTWVVQANDFLRYLVILIPITVSILQAGSAKSKGGTNYTLLRGSAEALKREIYRYRAQVGIYGAEQTESRDVKLARKVKTIGGQLMKTEANQTALKPYKGELPPYHEGPDDDDGFSDLDAEKYIKWRLENQLNWYKGRTTRFHKQVHNIQWLILIFGGVGTFLAAIGLEIWIAVTVSLTAAYAGLLELQQAEETLVTYNQTATDLDGVRIWWRALSDEEKAKPENKEKLVDYTESILKTELSGWVQEMMDSLAELYAEELPQKATKE